MFERSGLHVHNNPHIFNQLVTCNKGIAGPGGNSSAIWSQAPQQQIADPDYCFELFDDFLEYLTTVRWATFGDTPTIAGTDAKGGILSIVTGGVDNNTGGIGSQNQIFIPATDSKIFFEAKVKVAEANTDDVNIYVGMSAGTLASDVPLTDNGAGPTTDDAVGFFKVDGGTVWQAENSNGTSQTTTANCGTRSTSAYQRLGFIITGTSQIDYYIDGAKVASHTTNLPDTEMKVVIAVKEGGGGAETLLVDWVKAVQIGHLS